MPRQELGQPRAPISERPAGPLTAQCLAVPRRDAMVFVGLDWAAPAHAVCVLAATGTVRWRGSVPHSAEGLAELVRRLRQFGPPATVRVAIERPSGVVIDTLIDAGVQVVPIHPNVVKASRARYAAAHPKSDDGDRDLLADLLRPDGHRFRPLRPPDNVVVLLDCDNPRLDGDL